VNREIVRDRRVPAKEPRAIEGKDAAYYAANREKFAAYARAYLRVRANPEKFRACAARRRGRKNCALGEHTAAEWIGKKQEFGNRCADCGIQRGHESA
jgi:hypothetical protein